MTSGTGGGSPAPSESVRLPLVIFLVLLAILAVALFNRDPSSSGDGGGGGDQPRQAPVTVTGSGIENSAPFHLDGGDYRVTWTATPDSDTGCYHGADLESTEVSVFEPLTNELLDSSAPASGTTYIYQLDSADYYVQASSGCTWTFTFTQQ